MKKETPLEVFKHNKSVSSKLSEVRTPLQFLIYSLIVAKVDNSLKLENLKEEDLRLKITHKEILEQLEIKRLQPTFKKEIKELSHLQIEHLYEDNQNDFRLINVFSMLDYKNHILTVELNKKVIDYFIDLKSNFLSYSFKSLVKFKSKYTMFLYDLIQKDYYLLKRKYHFEYDLDFLFDKLQVSAKSMKIYQNFKIKILNKAMKEINTYTNIKIRYKAIKNAYTVEKIRFLPLSQKDMNNKEEYFVKDYKSLYEKEQQNNKELSKICNILDKKFNMIFEKEEEKYLAEIGEI